MSTQAEPSIKTRKVSAWPYGHTVVIVAPFPPPFGGMSLQANQLVALLQQEGVCVKSIDTNQKLPRRLAFVERVVFLRTLAHFVRFCMRIWQVAQPKTVFHIFSNSYASFFLWTGAATLIGRKRGAPVIINYRGGLVSEFLAKWRTPASIIFRQANKIIVPSRYLEFVFLQNRISTQIIPNIISSDLPRRSSREIDTPHLVVNRNFEPMYNLSCALRAFAMVQAVIPETRLTLIGEGPQRTELEKWVQNLGLQNVQFTGRLKNQEVIQTLLNCDVMLNPTNVDNMPISVIEAMALGLPVVSTNVGGVPYLIKNKVTGILVKKNDHQAMARAALRLIKSPALRKRLIENARRVTEDFRWERVWPLWRTLYLVQLQQGMA
jgi:glycosyltransferase involved in cell wall biosynthesis